MATKLRLGDVIQEEMTTKNLTLQQVADRSKLALQSIERYHKNEGTPTLTKFIKLASGLDLKPSDLFRRAVPE